MTGKVATWGKEETSWPHYGRRRLFMVAERDIQVGSLRALRLPEYPPTMRRTFGGRRAEALVTERVAYLLPPVLRR